MTRIDTHHHIFPPAYLAARGAEIIAAAPALEREVREWTPMRSIEAMDRAGIATACTSISAPGVWFGDAAESRRLARTANEFAARMADDHPGRFRVFAALPLPDVSGALAEIEYAFDVLKVAGVGLTTHCGDRWPGDATLAPVFDALDARGALVYFHPSCPDCCANLLPSVPPAIIEFPFDTVRAITSLLYGGVFTRARHCRFLFSHGGGALPMLAHRLGGPLRYRPDLAAQFPQGVLPVLQSLYADVVGVTGPIAWQAVRTFFGIDRLLFGTDYPYWPIATTGSGLDVLELTQVEREAINSRNAAALLARGTPSP